MLMCIILFYHQLLNLTSSALEVQIPMAKPTRVKRRKRIRNIRSTRNINMNIKTNLISLTSSYKKKTSVQDLLTLQVLLPQAAWGAVSPTAWQATCLSEQRLMLELWPDTHKSKVFTCSFLVFSPSCRDSMQEIIFLYCNTLYKRMQFYSL